MLKVERVGRFKLVTLAGERRNAFTRGLARELASLPCEDTVFTNDGPVFTAGLDLREVAGDDVEGYLQELHSMLLHLAGCEAFLAAYLRGDVYGFGVDFLLLMDYVAAAREDILISLQGINLGLFPPYTLALGPSLLPPAAMRLLMARPVTAREASWLGLVHWVGPLEEALKALYTPPPHVAGLVRPRLAVRDRLREVEPYLKRLAEAARHPETRRRVAQFLAR